MIVSRALCNSFYFTNGQKFMAWGGLMDQEIIPCALNRFNYKLDYLLQFCSSTVYTDIGLLRQKIVSDSNLVGHSKLDFTIISRPPPASAETDRIICSLLLILFPLFDLFVQISTKIHNF